MKNKKNIGKKVLLACVFATSLSSCSLFKDNKTTEKADNKLVNTKSNTSYQAKKTSIKKDKTTEVLLDAEIKKEDIVKVVKHGDHWHVFTKYGGEKITYTNPDQIENEGNFDMVSVVGNSQLKNKNVVSIKKHGDHYHVYLQDGTEYLTYENPSSLFPNIKIGTYIGNHGSQSPKKTSGIQKAQNKQIKEKLEKDEERVTKILKHGDHYHIYTSKGNEYVTYQDPRKLYPNASYGIYEGNHGDMGKMIAKNPKEDSKKQAKNKENKENTKTNKLQKDDSLIKVEDNKKTNNVIRILKHGDHYHIYTADGKEYISYSNPSSLYPDIPIGTYVGSHGDEKDNKDQNKKENPKIEENKKEDSKDYSQTNPAEDNIKSRIENLKITNILGKEKVDRYDIVKILKHGDHYHIYDSKGREGVTHVNPKDIYPKAKFGQYEGSHGDENKNKDEFKWPKEVTKIVSHGDHWHLYKGDEEIGVVTENPKSHYPNAEYIDESKDYSNVEVGDGDLFTYESVNPKKIPGIEKIFDSRFNEMNSFGQIKDEKPAFGPGGQYKGGNVFYWLHGDHYHYLSIEDLLKMEKAGELGEFTAKDIVATLKYKIENPDQKITKDYDDTKSELLRANILDLLKKTYPDAFVQNIELNFYAEDLVFHITDFEEKDGKVVYKKGKLPEIKKEEKPEEDEFDKKEEEDKEEENKKEDESDKNEDVNKDNKEIPENIEKKKTDPQERKEDLEKAQDGYASKENAEEAAKKALESDFANNSYDLFQGANGRWFYSLKVSY